MRGVVEVIERENEKGWKYGERERGLKIYCESKGEGGREGRKERKKD